MAVYLADRLGEHWAAKKAATMAGNLVACSVELMVVMKVDCLAD